MDLDDPKLVHLYNLAHYKCLNPISACHAIDADKAIAKAGIDNPRPRSHCDNCGTFLIPGLTSSTRIKYSKTISGRSRVLETHCLICSRVRSEDCLLNRKRTVTPQNPSTGAPKKKKKKKGNLSSLLEQKKQETNSPSLFDFM